MYIVNGVAYAGEAIKDMSVKTVKALDDMMLLITFTTGEKRLYDASRLLAFPAFDELKDETIFKSARVEYGVAWKNGEIDIAPESLYQNSIAYTEPLAAVS